MLSHHDKQKILSLAEVLLSSGNLLIRSAVLYEIKHTLNLMRRFDALDKKYDALLKKFSQFKSRRVKGHASKKLRPFVFALIAMLGALLASAPEISPIPHQIKTASLELEDDDE